MTEGFAPPPGPAGAHAAPARDHPGTAQHEPLGSPPRPPRRRSRRGATVAWIVGGAAALAIGGGVVADVVLSTHASRLEPVERGFTGRLTGVQAVAGLCLADAPVGESVGSLTSVPCAEPHRAETVAELRLDGDWPGDAAVAARATDFCAAQVARAVDGSLAQDVRWRVWTPTERTWAAGDRSALCVVIAEIDVTGSFEAGTAAPA